MPFVLKTIQIKIRNILVYGTYREIYIKMERSKVLIHLTEMKTFTGGLHLD